MRLRPSTVLLAPFVAVVVAGCGSGEPDAIAPTVTTPAPTTEAPVTTPTTPPKPTALLPGTTGGDPVYPEPTTPTTAAPITIPTPVTAAPTTVPETSAPTSDPMGGSVPPTTEPVALQELVLSGDGIGLASLGTDADQVVQYVTSILGSNTADSGWVDPETFGFCPGSTVRRVDWGVLSLLFSDASDVATGRPHFFGWEYGRLGEIGDEPVGLHTPGGVTLGSRVVDVKGEFPDALIVEGDPELELPDQYLVDDSFSGWISGPNDDDFVTVMFGGYRCGG